MNYIKEKKELLIDNAFILIGCFIASLGVNLFLSNPQIAPPKTQYSNLSSKVIRCDTGAVIINESDKASIPIAELNVNFFDSLK